MEHDRTTAMLSPPQARVSMMIRAPAAEIISAFVEPDTLTEFWLSSSSAALSLGSTVKWEFMVPGAEVETTATALDQNRKVAWNWADGTTVEVEAEDVGGATAVTVVNSRFQGTHDETVDAALNATEGFALVLADLKTLLETGTSAHIVRDKARLIELRR